MKASGFNRKPEDNSKGNQDDDNLVGKINALITSDLANMTKGRNFLFVGKIRYNSSAQTG
jgi:hypothetical protein